MSRLDITNKRFGRLVAIKPDLERTNDDKYHKSYWWCKCDCENLKSVNIAKLINKNTQSCGCLQSESRHTNHKKYNEYNICNYNYGILYIDNSEFLFDIDDYEKINTIYWHENDSGYAINCNNNIYTRLSRIVMDANDGEVVDHINRNPKDNRKANLRKCTQHENSFNTSLAINNTSGFIGVSKQSDCDRWCARICYNGKTIYLGLYKNKKDALIERLKGEIKYFGKEFAPQRHLFDEYLGGEV